jgi:hypothetical protein
MGVFVGVCVDVEVGSGGTVKETVEVHSRVQVANGVLVGKGVGVRVGVKVSMGGTLVAVLEGITTISGSDGVGKRALQAVASNMNPRATKLQSFFMFTVNA